MDAMTYTAVRANLASTMDRVCGSVIETDS